MDKSESHIILAVTFAQFVTPFMFSGVGVTLPAIGSEFSASGVQLGLIESIYMGASAAILLPMGKLADLTDKKQIFKLGLFLYGVITLLLALTGSIEVMLSLRCIQGLAGAMLLATSMAILTELVPHSDLGKAIGLAIGAVYLGLSSGPFIAGAITSTLGWRSVYIFGALLIFLSSAISYRYIPKSSAFKFVKIDFWGTFFISISMALLVAGSANLKTFMGPISMALGALFMCLFFVAEKRAAEPLLDLKLITKNQIFSYAIMIQFLNYAATFGMTLLFSLYLQSIKGMTAFYAGVVLVIAPVIMATLAPYFGRLSDRMAPSKIAFVGMCSCAVSIIIALTIDQDTSLLPVYIMFSFMGLGFAMFSSPNMNTIMSSVRKKDLGIASAVAAKMRTLGMVASLVIINTSLSIFIGDKVIGHESAAEYINAMRSSILVFLVLISLGIWFSVLSVVKNR